MLCFADADSDLRRFFSFLRYLSDSNPSYNRELVFTIALEELGLIVSSGYGDDKEKVRNLVRSAIFLSTGEKAADFSRNFRKVKVNIPGIKNYYWDPAKHPRDERGRFTFKGAPGGTSEDEKRESDIFPDLIEKVMAVLSNVTVPKYTLEEIEAADWDSLKLGRALPFLGIRGHVEVDGIQVRVVNGLTKEEFLEGIKGVKRTSERGKELLGDKFYTENMKVTFIPSEKNEGSLRYLRLLGYSTSRSESGFSSPFYHAVTDEITIEPKMFRRNNDMAECVLFHEMVHRDNRKKLTAWTRGSDEFSAIMFSIAYSRKFSEKKEPIMLVTYLNTMAGVAYVQNKKGQKLDDFLDELVESYVEKGNTNSTLLYFRNNFFFSNFLSTKDKKENMEKFFPGYQKAIIELFGVLGYQDSEELAVRYLGPYY